MGKQNFIELLRLCNSNIKGQTDGDAINTMLPIELSAFYLKYTPSEIQCLLNNDDLKVIYGEKNHFSNLAILKVLGSYIGIQPQGNDAVSILWFQRHINDFLQRGYA